MIKTAKALKVAMANDWTTAGVAAASILSPAWLPLIEEISRSAALFMPIFGVAWLGVQIWSRIFRNK